MLPTVVCDCYGNPHGQRREGIPVVYRRILCPCRCPREDQEPDTALGQPVCDSTDARSPKRVHPAETKKAACLNGVCYSLSLAYMRIPFCECPEKYEGARCEQLSLDYYLIFMSSSSMVKGLIIGGVFFILLIIIIIISVCCHKWKKRKRQRLQEMKNPDPRRGLDLSVFLSLQPSSRCHKQGRLNKKNT
ncbi:probetacellulin-like [Pomacea canaliculata]|uniref:probetacellulin-like n=1 Tax=Pomacea canaliculata TaxID=400727 RepID=UPI000D73CC62|nr:probetacellulin-like [Pomacea canaliculata]